MNKCKHIRSYFDDSIKKYRCVECQEVMQTAPIVRAGLMDAFAKRVAGSKDVVKRFPFERLI